MTPHELDPHTCYRALQAHDSRFDGVFFTAVATTGIYCRPICPARVPAAANCRFFRAAAQAEAAGFRACLRCRPELAPNDLSFLEQKSAHARIANIKANGVKLPRGSDIERGETVASVDAIRRLVRLAGRRIDAGYLNSGSVDDLAAELGVTARHLRRAMESVLGVSPVELAQTKRLSLAKHLLQDTQLPLVQIAFASGFASVRRFNGLFQARFGRPPSALRRELPAQSPNRLLSTDDEISRETISLRLDYRPPLAWDAVLAFLAARAIPGVEAVTDGAYRRTVSLSGTTVSSTAGKTVTGYLEVRLDETSSRRHALRVTISLSLAQVLPQVVARVRHLFDLDAQPAIIDGHLARDPRLRPLVRGTPGMRVPGAFDGFELAVRAIVGQQISVAATATLLGRIARRFGTTPSSNGMSGIDDARNKRPNSLFPTASTIAALDPKTLAEIGMPASRAQSIIFLAAAIAEGRVHLGQAAEGRVTSRPAKAPPGASCAVQDLATLPGIGPWTAEYIALRGLGQPDAFPASDLGVRKALGNVTAQAAEVISTAWRPWRAYAVIHLWRSLGLLVPKARPNKKENKS